MLSDEELADTSKIIDDIKSNRITLLEFVESLGENLTSVKASTRAAGTQCLAEILSQLPAEWLTEKEHAVLVQFVCRRLKDQNAHVPHHALKAALALIKCSAISRNDIQKITSTIFNEVQVQSLAQGDRRHVYHLVDYLLTSRLDDMKLLGSDFVFGYIQAMDGEKDPRNLVLAFKCVTAIGTNLSLDSWAESLFEVVACYFPIDFIPPPNDPHGVSKAELVIGLRRCLASTVQFAEFCLPLLMEKLSSSLQEAKIDSFLTLVECAATYGKALVEYSGSLWSSIRREVFAASSDSLEQASLSALVALTTALSKLVTPPDGSSILDGFITDIFQDVQRHLCDPEQRLVIPSSKILQSVASASAISSSTVLGRVVPILLEQLSQNRQVSDRKVLLAELLHFLKAAANWSNSDNNPVLPHKDLLYCMFVSLLSLASLRTFGVHGIMGLVAIPSMLSQQEVDACSQHFLQAALQDDPELRSAAVSGLSTLCTQLTPEGVDTLWAQLSERAIKDEGPCMEVMAGICSCYTLLTHSVDYYIKCLDRLGQDTGKEDLVSRTDEAVSVCHHLYTVVHTNLDHSTSVDYLYDSIPACIHSMCVHASIRPPCVLNQWRIVHSLAACVRLVVCKLDSSRAEAVQHATMSLLLEGDVSCLGDKLDSHADFSHFKPLQVDSPSCHTQLMCLFNAVVCSQPVTLTLTSPCHVTSILQLATRWHHEESSIMASKCLAGLVNKGKDIQCPSIPEITDGLNGSPDDQKRAVVVLSWLTKALLMKSDLAQREFVNKLVELLADPRVSLLAADGFRTILEEAEDILTPDMHTIIRFMYKQRLFVFTVDSLIEGFNASQNEGRLPYLLALSHLLKYVPHEAMTSHLATLLPLVVQCLHYDGEDLWISTLSTLDHMITESPDLVNSYFDDLLTHLLRLTRYKPKMIVRISALRCLQSLTSLPVPVVVAHQGQVTKALALVLDDGKRLVRKQAVQTRQKWLLIGAPGT